MFELNGEEYSLQNLQDAAVRYNMDFDSYLETMKKKGLVEKQTGSTEDPTMSLNVTGSESVDGSSELPEDKGFIEDMVQVYRQSKATAGTIDDAFDIYKLGKDISDEQIQSVLDAKAEMDKYGPTNEQASFAKDQKANGGGIVGTLLALKDNPGFIPQFLVGSAVTMGGSLQAGEVRGATALSAGVGAAGGAAAGSTGFTLGPLGAATTAAGAVTGTFSGAIGGLVGSMETGLTLMDLIQEEVGEGVKLTKENIRAVIDDTETFEKIKQRAAARGRNIGAVEAMTLGISRGVGSQLVKAGKFRRAGVATTAIETTGGFTGEIAGQIGAEQDIDLGEATLEAIGEVTGAGQVINVAEIVKGTLQKSEYNINGEKRSKQEILDLIESDKLTSEEKTKIKFNVKNDEKFAQLIGGKLNDISLETQIDAKVEDPADRTKLVDLEKQRAKAEADTKKSGIFKVINADTKLENIEMQINEIVGKYTAIDGRTADVKARKKTAEQVKENIAEKDFQTNLEFAKKHSALYGLEVDDTMTVDQIEKQYGKEAATSDGFIDNKNNRIVINKVVAKDRKAVNVGNHELLHGILRKGLKEGKINESLITDLETKFGKENWSKITGRIKGAGYTTEYMNDNPDEYLTLLSDAIANNEIKFDENVFTKIGDLIAPILRPFGFKKIGFEDANSTYEFLKEYNRSIHKGALSSAIVKQTAGKVDAEGIKMSRSQLVDTINDLQQKATTKADFQKPETFNKVFEAVQPGGAINNYIRSLQMSPEKTQETIDAVTDRLINFDPEAKRKDGTVIGPKGLGEFIMANVGFGKLVAAEKLFKKGEKAKRETSIDTEEAKQIADKPTTKKVTKEGPKARVLKSLADVNLDNKEIISTTARAEINALIEQNPKNLEEQITKIIDKEITKAVKAQMGKISNVKSEVVISDEYKAFIALNYENIVQGLDVNTIKNNYKTLFELTEIGKEDRKTKKADKPSLKKDSNYRKGIFKIETNKAKFTKFFTEGGYTTLLARQKGLANQIAKGITEDIVNNEIINNSNNINSIIKAEIENLGNQLNRQKDEVVGNYADIVKFSKTYKQDITQQTYKLIREVNKAKTITDVFSLETQQPKKGKYDPWVVRTVFEQWMKGNVYANQEQAAVNALKKIPANVIKENRGTALEQYVINLGVKAAKTYDGLTMLGESVMEGGIPDFFAAVHGFALYAETKFGKARAGKTSINYTNFKTGKFEVKKAVEGNIELVNESVKKALKRGSKDLVKTLKGLGVDLIDSETVVPLAAHSQVNKGSLSDATVMVGGDFIAKLYTNKEYPVHLIEIAGAGVYYMEGDPFITQLAKELGIPKLEGKFPLKTRILAQSVKENKKTVGYKYKLTSEPEIEASMLNVKSPYTLTDLSAFDAIMKSKTVANLKVQEQGKNKTNFSKSVNLSRTVNDSKGITVLDFDDTLATTESLVKYTRPDGTTGTLNAEEYASTYEDLLGQGFTFDFSDFNKVVKGKVAPLFNKAIKLQGKFGPENMFVLTARPPQAAKAIFDFLKANGLNIPMKNITGLANSTSEAKALWIADKVGEGYNDFYFADDALQNVQAVKNMLDQFDVKSKVQQAKVKFSKSMNDQFNDILENVTGIDAAKRFSAIKGRKRGESKGKFRFFIPPSHEDFVGLLYNFLGKGKEGNAHRDFFEKALIRPLNRANREYDTARQSVANDYKALNKQFPDIRKKLTKKTPDGDFTFQDAIRVYLWNKHGHKIPGLSETDQTSLSELVMADPQLQTYAETLNVISKQDTYVTPTEGWNSGDIRMDLDDATGRIGRQQFFAEFIENAEVIFSEENLNKIEAGYGKGVRESLEDMLYRIKTGRNRPSGQNEQVNKLMNYLNGSVGTVMFFNMRSALLQQMSIVNYINFADNNIFAAAKAFANQKQYWKDFAFIFNSDMLKQRRGGIQTDVNGAELAASLRNSKDITRKLISKLLELGFLPTQIGDNIAIATGGAAYYRNMINKYVKQGMSQKEAEAKAFTDFQAITQSTQQSARPDMVSKQQASVIGKVILNFQNVTSQFNRLGKKAFQDIYNRRITKPNTTQMQSDISNAARITYYFAVQNAIFYTLQTALFAMMFDDDEEDDNKLFLKKKERLINGSIDSVLRGSGLIGGVVATLKNVAIAFARQRDVKYNPDESAVGLEALNLSPVLGIKLRKIVNAEKTLNYNKKVIKEMETFDIDNPQWSAATNYVEAFTNVPLNRLYNKTQNVRQALNNEHSAWERSLMFLGWSQYNLDLENKKMKDIKESVKSKKKTKKKDTRKLFNTGINL